MYKNPLNNGDLSDYNSLKNQKDYRPDINKYQSSAEGERKRKLKTKPSELQKYYEYLTYQQPILDELNYIAEKQKTEDLEKQKNDYSNLEKVKQQREDNINKTININEPKTEKERIKEELFDEPKPFNLKMSDLTPNIQTNNELEFEIQDKNFTKEDDAVVIDLDIGKPAKNKGLLLESNNYQETTKNKPLLLEFDNYQETAKQKLQDAINKYGISTDLSLNMNRLIKNTEPKKTTNEKNIDFFNNITKDLPIKSDLQIKEKQVTKSEKLKINQEDKIKEKIKDINSSIASQADTLENIPRNKRKGKGGRPKGSKNTPKRTLNL